jgi:hypothetical protein
MIKDLTDFVILKIREISEVGDERSKDCIKGLVNYLVISIYFRSCCSIHEMFTLSPNLSRTVKICYLRICLRMIPLTEPLALK